MPQTGASAVCCQWRLTSVDELGRLMRHSAYSPSHDARLPGLHAMQSTEAARSASADDAGETTGSLIKVLTWENSACVCQVSEIIIERGCLAVFQRCKLSAILEILRFAIH
jgi:hypothetical protein